MPFDVSQIHVSDGNVPLQATVKPQTYDTLAEALDAANRDKGNELVVEFTSPDTHAKTYAIVDIQTKSNFDPNQLEITGLDHIQSVVYTQEHQRLRATSNDQASGSERADTINEIQVLSFPDRSIETNADSALAIARAAYAVLPNHGAGGSHRVSGFNYDGANTHWGEQVQANLLTASRVVTETLSKVNDQINQLQDEITAGRQASPPADVTGKQKQLAHLVSQRDELTTYREMLTADLLVSPVDQQKPIPGAADPAGRPLTVGAFRNDFGSAIGGLEAYRTMLVGTATQRSPESQQALLQAVDGRITSLQQRRLDILQSDANQAKRLTALSGIRSELATVQERIAVDDERIATLEEKAKNGGIGDGERAELRSLRHHEAGLARALAAKLDGYLTDYKASSTGRGVAREVIQLLSSHVHQLRKLADTVDGGAPSAFIDHSDAEQRMLVGVASAIQRDLLAVVKTGAQQYDGVDPPEVKILQSIQGRADDLRQDYEANRARYDAVQSKVDKFTQIARTPSQGPGEDLLSWLQTAQHYEPGNGGTDPFAVNQAIVGFYQDFGKSMAQELGDPSLVTWGTFAAHACNAAGEQISHLEGTSNALHTMFHGLLNVRDKYHAGVFLKDQLTDPENLRQMVVMLAALDPKLAAELKDAANGNPGPAMMDDLALRVLALIPKVDTALDHLRTAFVQGNTNIAHNVLQANLIYHQAGGGSDGIKALRAAVAAGHLKDPQGYLVKAFQLYNKAIAKGVEAQDPSIDETTRQKLRAEQHQLVDQMSLLIGWQEQATFLQTDATFGDEIVGRVLQAESRHGTTLNLPNPNATDAHAEPYRIQLTENWQHLQSRMGAEDSSAQEYANSLSEDDWKAENAQRQSQHRPELPSQNGSNPEGMVYVALKVEKGMVVTGTDGKRVPEGTELYFRTNVAKPKEGTIAKVFIEGNDPHTSTYSAVRKPVLHVAKPFREDQYAADADAAEAKRMLARNQHEAQAHLDEFGNVQPVSVAD